MQMSDEEILRSFKEAKYPAMQVQILADLNLTHVANIKRILMAQGVDPKLLPWPKSRTIRRPAK